MVFDTHTHLNYEYPVPVDEIVARARKAGVSGFLTIATEKGLQHEARELAERFEDVWFSVGLHPHEAKHWSAETLAEMEREAAHPKCVAIGELGLDYWYGHSSRDEQITALEGELDLAIRLKKPIVVHARNAKDPLARPTAEEDLLPHFERYAREMDPALKAAGRVGILHCFSGTRAFAETCLDLGFHISFSGILTFKTAGDLRDIARDVPLDRLLVETDAPYLAPEPHRGKKNESAYVVHTARALALCKQMSYEDLAAATTANAKRLLGLQ